MQNIKDFLESKETYGNVLTILKCHSGNEHTFNQMMATIDSGFIAGGSVSNALISLFHGDKKQCVINDIDVYKQVSEAQTPYDDSRNQWYPATYVNEEGLEMYDDSYGRIFVSDSGARMRVTKHSRRGIFNIVEYLYEPSYSRRKGKSKETVILEGFDLNCCKSGIDITNEKIIYTPEFVEFLETKKLKVTSPCAPIQSTIRLHKKMKDLDCTCDIEHEMRFLSVALKRVHSGQMMKYVGPETYNKYLHMKGIVDKYFTLRRAEPNEIPHSLRGKDERHLMLWVYEPVMKFDILENVNSLNSFKRIWDLLYTVKNGEEQDKINKIFYKNIYLGKMDEDIWFKSININDDWLGGTSEMKPSYDSDRFTYSMLLIKNNYHKCDFDLKHVDFIDTFTSHYPEIKMFLKSCETIIEQYELIRVINSIRIKEGDWVFSFLGNLQYSNFVRDKMFGYEILINPKLKTKENISNIIIKEKKFRDVNRVMRMYLNKHQFVKRNDIYSF